METNTVKDVQDKVRMTINHLLGAALDAGVDLHDLATHHVFMHHVFTDPMNMNNFKALSEGNEDILKPGWLGTFSKYLDERAGAFKHYSPLDIVRIYQTLNTSFLHVYVLQSELTEVVTDFSNDIRGRRPVCVLDQRALDEVNALVEEQIGKAIAPLGMSLDEFLREQHEIGEVIDGISLGELHVAFGNGHPHAERIREIRAKLTLAVRLIAEYDLSEVKRTFVPLTERLKRLNPNDNPLT
jgi:hypothetical protein